MEPSKDHNKCFLTTLGYSGAAFIAMAACAENLEKYLFATGTFWIVAGTVAAACWAYETFCVEIEEDDE